jgi:hypothetical protein
VVLSDKVAVTVVEDGDHIRLVVPRERLAKVLENPAPDKAPTAIPPPKRGEPPAKK